MDTIQRLKGELRQWLASKPMTQPELAKLAGVSLRSIQYALEPGWNPKATTLSALERAMRDTTNQDAAA